MIFVTKLDSMVLPVFVPQWWLRGMVRLYPVYHETCKGGDIPVPHAIPPPRPPIPGSNSRVTRTLLVAGGSDTSATIPQNESSKNHQTGIIPTYSSHRSGRQV